MNASCDVLLPEQNTDTSASSKPTAIVKPSHKQEPSEAEEIIEKEIKVSEEQLKSAGAEIKVKTNDCDDISKNVVANEVIDSHKAKTEVVSEHAVVSGVRDASAIHHHQEDDNGRPLADAGAIAQAEKVVEVTQESLEELSAQIMRCDEEISSHQAEIKRVDTNNEQMLIVVDEFEKTIQQIVRDREKETVYLEIQKEAAGRERDEVVADLQNVERAFTDLSSKYERTKDVVASFATTEEGLKQNVEVLTDRSGVWSSSEA